ncbi:-U3 small nucleolar RNA-associated protein 25 [Babesia bigemina]|uniref:-U3 small nucleolar RNA-associated protein 25 n=1 Tax=Babesia bigemina TaxID=5866 RepID=A0A061DEQ0_BABBI|nr:-U3 small nucleolar RNA-associated protein 25 [Babesia bigemina]CDR97665.1 -U3 small nucleolar RNA-associated protein 25 [Babesia bigemina]|eukprot:XP_012769851.1 -U3 small nucleolar RNA-associated protein 25 [Babesia bigemina]
MEGDDSESEPPSAFEHLLQVLGKRSRSDKRRKITKSDSNVDNIAKILSDSFDADAESEPEEVSEESSDGICLDAFDSFNMGYDDYLRATEPITATSPIPIPFFKSCQFKFLTPILQQVLKSKVLPRVVSGINSFGFHEALQRKITKLHKKARSGGWMPKDRSRLRYFFNCMNSYLDVFYAGCKVTDVSSMRFLMALHAANHICKSVTSTVEQSHGFTRPRVLYICGLKCMARDFIQHLVTLLSVKKGDPKVEKFYEEYDLPEEDTAAQVSSFSKTHKSLDYVETFSGNQDDAFKMGLRYQGGMLHLYTPFYTSDIIVTSPLGIKIMLQEDEEYDFLSSIEVLLIDRMDVLKFQNWQFFIEVFEKLNRPLKKWRDADLSRLRVSTIDGQSEVYRQTVGLSCTQHFVFNAFFKRLVNRRGFIKLASVPTQDFVLLGSQLRVKQLFIKVAASSVTDADGSLLNYFLKNMLNSIQGIGGVLVVLGDYTHFLRVKKELKMANFEYLPCHESNSSKQMLFARQQFQAGKTPVVLTTSRLLFFKRYVIKGTCRVLFVVPPDYPEIYREAFRMLDLSKNNALVTLYTRFHAHQLEPIVGAAKVHKLVSAADTKVTEFH